VTGPLLSVRDMRTRFESPSGPIAYAVDGVSFDVHPGETVGLVGESGCGKTVTALSLLRLLPGSAAVIDPASSAVFAGRELLSASDAEVRAVRGDEIAMIFQEPSSSLNPVFTVGEQIAESLREHRGSERAAAWARAVELLGEVGIPDAERRAGEYPHQLSGGMRQRVMIAIAIACEPKLLIADEPTTALDVTIQAQILDLLRRLRERHSMAVLLITHDLGVVAEVCDRVVIMYAGQVVETGRVTEVFERPAHPYTRGLLASLPGRVPEGGRLQPIPGGVPSPTERPVGCRFRPRCPSATGGCEREQELRPLEGVGRASRCWLSAGEEDS